MCEYKLKLVSDSFNCIQLLFKCGVYGAFAGGRNCSIPEVDFNAALLLLQVIKEANSDLSREINSDILIFK